MVFGVAWQQVMPDYDCQGLLPNVIKAELDDDLKGRSHTTAVASTLHSSVGDMVVYQVYCYYCRECSDSLHK